MCKTARKYQWHEAMQCAKQPKNSATKSFQCAKQHRNISDTGLLDVQNSTETSATQVYSMCKTAQKHQRHRATRCAKQHRSINDIGLLDVQNSTEASTTQGYSVCKTAQKHQRHGAFQCAKQYRTMTQLSKVSAELYRNRWCSSFLSQETNAMSATRGFLSYQRRPHAQQNKT